MHGVIPNFGKIKSELAGEMASVQSYDGAKIILSISMLVLGFAHVLPNLAQLPYS